MTTRTTLRTAIRNLQTSTAMYSDAQVNQWINAGILDYSLHFPRRKRAQITIDVSHNYYELAADVKGIVVVEYFYDGKVLPNVAPTYLERKLYTLDGFFDEFGYYDVIKQHEATLTGADYWQIVLSQPAQGALDLLFVDYMGDHATLANDTDSLTVPARHEHLLYAFCRWQMILQLSIRQMETPDSFNPMVTQLELNAQRAEKAYRDAIAQAKKAESEGVVVQWMMDKWEGTY